MARRRAGDDYMWGGFGGSIQCGTKFLMESAPFVQGTHTVWWPAEVCERSAVV